MRASLLPIHLSPHVRETFDDECRALLKTCVQRPVLGHEPPGLLRFAEHYQYLLALPRRRRRSIERYWRSTLSAIALLMTLGHTPALAATIPVAANTPPAINSDGKCSLIEAIVNANSDAAMHSDCVAGSGTDTIVLRVGSEQRITSSTVLPDILSKIVVEGRRSTIVRDDVAPSEADLLRIRSAGDLTLNETIVSGGTGVRDGWYNDDRGRRGIANFGGNLTLRESSIINNIGGGGLLNQGGTVTLDKSTVASNYKYGWSDGYGGIINSGNGTMTLRGSSVSNNTHSYSYIRASAILNEGGSSLTLINTTISQNFSGGITNVGMLILSGSSVLSNKGSGLTNFSAGTARVTSSTIFGNDNSTPVRDYYYLGGGGGINNKGILSVTNSTISGNKAVRGGGIENRGTLTLSSSTITGNTALNGGGGLLVVRDSRGSTGPLPTVALMRTLVSGNKAGFGSEINNEPAYDYYYNYGYDGGIVTANNHNLIGHNSDAGSVAFTPGPLDIVPSGAVSDVLLPLANNGSPTFTHALAIASPAIDTSPIDAHCPAKDQRGNPRPRGAACDIGAFEGSAVLCNGFVTTMVGTSGSDVLTGTPGPDIISGLGGSDLIRGLDGDDVICGSGGNDRLVGGRGNDVLFGGSDNDHLFGQRDDDTLDGGNGADACDGGVNSSGGDTASNCESVSNVP